MDANTPLGLGLIGCGAFGRFCLEAFAELDSVRLAAVADVRPEAAEQFARDFNVPAHADPAELIARDDVQLVHVATPPSTHYELVTAAVGAGKHVLCEKPLAVTVKQADEMLAGARRAGVIAPVNFVLRYNPTTDAVKAVIDSGVLGQVLGAQLTNCASDSNLGPDHWFWNRDVSGGLFIEHGVHFFDLYSHWLGEGRVISAHTETRGGRQQDRVMCTVRHAGGAVARHYHGFDQVGPMDRTDHRLVCELGDIRVEGWIPLSLSIDAAVDDKAESALRDICPGADVETIDSYDARRGRTSGRGRSRTVSKRIRLRHCPHPDKQSLYARSVRDLLADQVAAVRDANHPRRVTEQNGRDALALAEQAVLLAN